MDVVSQVISGDYYDIYREHGVRMIRPPRAGGRMISFSICDLF